MHVCQELLKDGYEPNNDDYTCAECTKCKIGEEYLRQTDV